MSRNKTTNVENLQSPQKLRFRWNLAHELNKNEN